MQALKNPKVLIPLLVVALGALSAWSGVPLDQLCGEPATAAP